MKIIFQDPSISLVLLLLTFFGKTVRIPPQKNRHRTGMKSFWARKLGPSHGNGAMIRSRWTGVLEITFLGMKMMLGFHIFILKRHPKVKILEGFLSQTTQVNT